MDVVILCGGLGTRLRSADKGLPKVLVPISKRPFLEILIDHLRQIGFERFILCAGYRGNVLRKHFDRSELKSAIVMSQEGKLLGTAGAVKNCARLIRSNPFVVMNGDSFCNLDFPGLIRQHKRTRAIATVTVVPARLRKDGGYVEIGRGKRILRFGEKQYSKAFKLSAGIYVFDRKLLQKIPSRRPCSLEFDVFPRLAGDRFYGYLTKKPLYDMGTPDRLKKFRQVYKTLRKKVV